MTHVVLPTTRLTKRQRVVAVTIVLSLLLAVMIQQHLTSPLEVCWLICTYLGTVWILDLDLKHEEWLVLPLYPILWGVACLGWFEYLAPTPIYTAAGVVVYGVGVYALLLATNILNLATIRTVPLSRTALTIMQLAGLWCAFLLFYLVRAYQPSLWMWVGEVGAMSLLVAWPLLWSSTSSSARLLPSIGWSAFVALVSAQLALATGFWPSSLMTSLFLACITLIVIGLLHYQERRLLTAAMRRQYVILGLVVFVAYWWFTRWG